MADPTTARQLPTEFTPGDRSTPFFSSGQILSGFDPRWPAGRCKHHHVGQLPKALAPDAVYRLVRGYCGDHDAATAEMAKLAPYEAGLGPEGQHELREQRRLIARLRREAPPPQWELPALPRKTGPNERCYCGSGKKFKRCHGMRS
jgi:SEC-C motif